MVASLTFAFAPALAFLQESGGTSIVEALMYILSNPLSIVTVLVGSLVFAVAFGMFGYLVLGAVGDAASGPLAIDDHRPRQRD